MKTDKITKCQQQKIAFTLAEGTPCFENPTCVKQHAFTLAEVLIVIGVIGVVAAITIPTLINTISAKAKKSQTDVIEARLLDGINRYSAMEDGLSQKYETTYDFLIGLSKYYKMAQICKDDKITKCIPYSKIYSSDGSKSADVKSLKTIHQFIPGEAADNYLAPASFISAQGTPFVMALKKNCVWDTGQAMKSIEDSDCIAYLYDKNGAGLPNRLGDDSDIIGHGLTVNGFPLAILGGVKIMTNAFVPTPITASDCNENKNTYGITNCRTSNDDYWGGAMKYCKSQGWHLSTDTELTAMANALYKGMNANASGCISTYSDRDENNNYYTIGSKEALPDTLSGLGSSWNYLWSSSEFNSSRAAARYFVLASTTIVCDSGQGTYRSRLIVKAICVAD